MPCYAIEHITVHNPEGYKKYAEQVPATIAAHGGKYLVRGGECKDIEGTMPHDRHVVIEFPTREALAGWYYSADYQEILKIRLANAKELMTTVDGFEG